jgi:hypothetical protein
MWRKRAIASVHVGHGCFLSVSVATVLSFFHPLSPALTPHWRGFLAQFAGIFDFVITFLFSVITKYAAR